MSSGSALNPNTQWAQTDRLRSHHTGATFLFGSFQGFTSTNYLPQQSRGDFFTVTWIATGQYRVALNLNLPNQVQPLGATANLNNLPGNPAGLIQEPTASVLSESTQTAPLIPTARASRVDKINAATLNTFDIFTFNSAGSAADVSTADRIQFRLAYKLNGFNP